MSEEKLKIRYLLPLIDRIGQLSWELFALRNLYPLSEYDVTVVTPPLESRPRTNLHMFEIALRGMNVEFTTDEALLHSAHQDLNKPIEVVNGEILNLNTINVPVMFLEKYSKTKTFDYRFTLSEQQMNEGNKLKRELGIPSDAKIITLHAREGGYLPDKSYHSFRDVNVANYIPTIEYLLGKGYFVVRLGDKSMAKFEGAPENLIDAPFNPLYNSLFESYFISQSSFYIGTTSGPIAMAFGFDIPALQVNAPIHWTFFGFDNDLLVPKHFYSKKLDRALTLEEIINSPLLDFTMTEEFESAEIEVRENSAEEILLAIQEFEARLGGGATSYAADGPAEEQVAKILRRSFLARKEDFPNEPLYLHMLDCRFSSEFLKQNPYFVGHQW